MQALETIEALKLHTAERLKLITDTFELMAANLAAGYIHPELLRTYIPKFDILFEIGEEPSMKSVPALLRIVGMLLDVKECALLVRHTHRPRFMTICSLGSETGKGYECGMDDGIMGFLKRTSGPLVISDPTQIAQLGFGEEVRSIAAFPLLSGGRLEGAFLAFNRDWSSKDISTTSLICNFMTLLLKDVEICETLDAIAKDVRKVSTMLDMVREMNDIRDIGKLLNIMSQKSKELAGAKRASAMVVERMPEDTIVVKAVGGVPQEISERLRFVKKGSVTHYVVMYGKPILVRDIEAVTIFTSSGHRGYETSSFVSIPMKLGNGNFGVLNVTDKLDGGPFTWEDLGILTDFARYAALAIERTSYYQELKRQEFLAITDELTGLYNRRYFMERLEDEIQRSRRYSHPLCVTVIDVDDFKLYNDTNGHILGDKVLKDIADMLKGLTRRTDMVFRLGGDEFAIVFPETSKEIAEHIVERIREAIRNHKFMGKDAQPKRLTVSLGVAAYPDDAERGIELLEKADQAMYQAKIAGKDRVVLYSPDTPVLSISNRPNSFIQGS